MVRYSTIITWEWLAGFYEGEGTCGCYKYKQNTCYRLSMIIVQKQKEILNKIKRFIKCGSIIRTFKNDQFGKRHCYQFMLQCAKARWFLNKILPYCRSKYKINQILKALTLDKKYVNIRK